MSYSALDSAPFFENPEDYRPLTSEEIKQIEKDRIKQTYISTYLPLFPDLKLSIIDYINQGNDILIKNKEGKTLLESWLNTSRSQINEMKEQRSVSDLLFNPSFIVPDILKDRMIQLSQKTTLVRYNLKDKTEEQKAHFIRHFDIVNKIKQTEQDKEIFTSWLSIFQLQDIQLIEVAKQYHPDFSTGLKITDEQELNLAHRVFLYLARASCGEEVLENNLKLLHFIKEDSPELFEQNHEKVGTPYDLSLKIIEKLSTEEKDAKFQTDIVVAFFIEYLINNNDHRFIELLHKKDSDNFNMAHRAVNYMTQPISSLQNFEKNLDLLLFIDNHAPHLFEEKHPVLGTPYELALNFSSQESDIDLKSSDNKIVDHQIEKTLSFFLHKKMSHKIEDSHKKTVTKKKI